MKQVRTMDQAIRDYAAVLAARRCTEEHARGLYEKLDTQYRESVNHRTKRGCTYLYNCREGCALYLKERYGVEMG